MDTYFSKFPVITYSNTSVRNITQRVSIVPSEKRLPTNFYPYELSEGIRSDVLSWSYYNDPTQDWLIYLANGMTDPYYDWYLSTDEFNAFIIKKYGSIENAQNDIVSYRNNWYDDSTNLTVAGYEALTEPLKKYWVPVFGAKAKILHYHRRAEDWARNTNQIVQVTISNTVADFVVGEIIDTVEDLGTMAGSGKVMMANSTTLMICHVSGNTSANAYITGRTSAAYANITSSSVLEYVIPLEEQVYWSPKTSYDIENEHNESKKFLYVLDSGFAMATSETIRRQLNSG